MGLEGLLKPSNNFINFPEIPDNFYQNYVNWIISLPSSISYGAVLGTLIGGVLGELVRKAEGYVWSFVKLAIYSAVGAVVGFFLASQGWIMEHAFIWLIWTAYKKFYKVMQQNDMDYPTQNLDLEEEIEDYLNEKMEVHEDE